MIFLFQWQRHSMIFRCSSDIEKRYVFSWQRGNPFHDISVFLGNSCKLGGFCLRYGHTLYFDVSHIHTMNCDFSCFSYATTLWHFTSHQKIPNNCDFQVSDMKLSWNISIFIVDSIKIVFSLFRGKDIQWYFDVHQISRNDMSFLGKGEKHSVIFRYSLETLEK